MDTQKGHIHQNFYHEDGNICESYQSPTTVVVESCDMKSHSAADTISRFPF